jgi:hypothetical protein
MKFMESFLATRSKVSSAEPVSDLPGGIPDWSSSASEGRDEYTGDGRGSGFQSLKAALLGGRKRGGSGVSEARAVELPVPVTDESPAGVGEPTLEVVRNGDKVEKLIVTCSCCRRIELDCSY